MLEKIVRSKLLDTNTLSVWLVTEPIIFVVDASPLSCCRGKLMILGSKRMLVVFEIPVT
jgi:hypothetical protein